MLNFKAHRALSLLLALLVCGAAARPALAQDSDGDGLTDVVEFIYGTDPFNADSDFGGMLDGAEVLLDGTDPLNPADDALDSDFDGLSDSAEFAVTGTDPFNPDTDGGGQFDGEEALIGNDPTNPIDDFGIPFDSDGDFIADNSESTVYNTNPFNPDSDSDGLTDGEEVFFFATDPLNPDTDNDGLDDGDEVIVFGTDPFNPDSDLDGLADGDEINTFGTDPNNPDSDFDGLADYEEVNVYGTDPNNPDSDLDGLPDWDEINTFGTDPNNPDSDFDGLADGDEINNGTNPGNPDTDSDQLTDGEEVNVYGTDPLNPDSDFDGLNDFDEVFAYGTDPLNPDTDSDGLDDGDEINLYGTDPNNPDTDNGGVSDGDEVNSGTDPLNPADDVVITTPPAPGMYAVDNAGNFFTIDLATGAPTIISSGFASSASSNSVTELEFNDATGRGIVQDSNGSFTFNELDFVTGLPLGPTIPNGAAHLGMEWIGGVLYTTTIPGPGGAPSQLETLDPATGATTVIGPTGLSNISGLAHDTSTGTLYGVTAGGAPSSLVSIDLLTGAATVIGNTQLILGALEFGHDGFLYAGGAQVNANELWRIDPATGAGTFIGNTGLGANAITGLALAGSPCGFENHSFETGDFTGWVTQDLLSPFEPLRVDASTGYEPGFGFGWGTAATDGLYTAYHGFDGDGLTSGFPISIAQDVTVHQPGLSFDWRAAWDMLNFGPPTALDRTFDVVIRPSGGGAELARYNVLVATGATQNLDTGQQTTRINLGAFLGQNVRVSFEWTVPEDFSGPAHFQLDNVCLDSCPADTNGDGVLDNGDIGTFVTLFLAGSLAADFNGDGVLDNGDIGAFVQAFLGGC